MRVCVALLSLSSPRLCRLRVDDRVLASVLATGKKHIIQNHHCAVVCCQARNDKALVFAETTYIVAVVRRQTDISLHGTGAYLKALREPSLSKVGARGHYYSQQTSMLL